MAVVQEAFDIPADIMQGIAQGKMRRIGGVVRYAVGPNKGQIVKHLDPIALEGADEAKNVAGQVLQLAKHHKKAAVIILAGGGVIITGDYIRRKAKNREPKELREFRNALSEYIESVKQGKLKKEHIDNLLEALEKLKAHKKYDQLTIRLTAEELDTIVNQIHEFTIKLAEDNDIDVSARLVMPYADEGDTMNSLQNSLETQRYIFEKAA